MAPGARDSWPRTTTSGVPSRAERPHRSRALRAEWAVSGMEPGRQRSWSPRVIVGAGTTVVIDRTLPAVVINEVRAAMCTSSPAVEFLAAVTAYGVRDLPPFAYLGREGDDVRVLLCGPVTARMLDRDGQLEEASAAGASTWMESLRTGCEAIELVVSDEVILEVRYETPSAVAPRPEPAPSVLEPHTTTTVAESPQEPPVRTAPTIYTSEALEAEHAISRPHPRLADDEKADQTQLGPAPPAAADEVDLSHLFDTRHVGVEAAAVRTTDETDAPTPPPAGSGPAEPIVQRPAAVAGAVARLADLPPPAGQPTPMPPPQGLIAHVPKEVRGGEDAEPEAEGDGLTISASQLAALREATMRGAGSGNLGETQLQAVACLAGHLNPPHAPVCRSCGSAIDDRTIRVVRRPSLGHLRFDEGPVVDLDRPLLIGRKPTVDGLPPGAELPGLVVLPDPDGSLSRVHAEVRIDGWEVLIVDRHSTNGTFVEPPGGPVVMLRPMEPCLIAPGTRIGFADVASCAFQTGSR